MYALFQTKEHEVELADFDKQYQQQQNQQDAAVLSPLDVAEQRLQIVARHEIDLASTEIQVGFLMVYSSMNVIITS